MIRNLMGLRNRESLDELRLSANLPESVMIAGKNYGVRTLQYVGKNWSQEYELSTRDA
ncbi:MAG TPA: hypothetical protein VJX16_19425 [Terriglobales bacterium]|nr:hypothetical protein [Terriglobales bacterium]